MMRRERQRLHDGSDARIRIGRSDRDARCADSARLGNVDIDRLKRSIDILVDADSLPRTPTVSEIFTPDFLPPTSELPKKLF